MWVLFISKINSTTLQINKQIEKSSSFDFFGSLALFLLFRSIFFFSMMSFSHSFSLYTRTRSLCLQHSFQSTISIQLSYSVLCVNVWLSVCFSFLFFSCCFSSFTSPSRQRLFRYFVLIFVVLSLNQCAFLFRVNFIYTLENSWELNREQESESETETETKKNNRR